jgi:hypothetical protein
MFDQWFFGINNTPKNLDKRFWASYSNIGYPCWRRWKMVANCYLLWLLSFQSSLDLFKHCDSILVRKNGFILKMLTLFIDIPLSNFNSKWVLAWLGGQKSSKNKFGPRSSLQALQCAQCWHMMMTKWDLSILIIFFYMWFVHYRG